MKTFDKCNEIIDDFNESVENLNSDSEAKKIILKGLFSKIKKK